MSALTVALVVGLATRTSLALPRTSVDEVRAAACCATHCPMKPARPTVPNRCCFAGSPASDPAAARADTTLRAPASDVVMLPPVSATTDPRAMTAAAATLRTVRAGPPRYLLVQTLRC